jgi:phosphohistidine swiveling domain-containing protein
MLALRDCATFAAAGPKACRLSRALAMGISVPDGVVILPSEPLPSFESLQEALSRLWKSPWESATQFVVRSSALAEDLAGQSAAGLFLSRTHVPIDDVVDAIRSVRESGETELIKLALGQTVPVAVLIQRQVDAERLGVLYRSQLGELRCEEREAGAPEWADVTVIRYGAGEVNQLSEGAAQLATLLSAEEHTAEPVAIYAEYAVTKSGLVTFLQARPAPPTDSQSGFVIDDDREHSFRLDQEHNPDPLSAAQQGLVDAVADLVPWLRQRVVRGYLYYAQVAGKKPQVMQRQTREVFTTTILPTCEAMLGPAEKQLLAADGALRADLLTDALGLDLGLGEALSIYRSIYDQYVGLLGPAIKWARTQLDELLLANLGEPLGQHGDLLAGIGGAQTERVQLLWELGRAGCPQAALRRVLARFGAFSSGWDVRVPCDDEQPDAIADYARHLFGLPETPEQKQKAALLRYQQAVQTLESRLPRAARSALQSLVLLVRDAMRVAEDDDLLFFRAQRLVRWALRARGAKLLAMGRLSDPQLVFDLPWRPWRAGQDPFDYPADVDLSRLARAARHDRLAAQKLLPPQRIVAGRPEWDLPDGRTLSGSGISATQSVVTGRALVVPSLDDPEASLRIVLSQLSPDTILVLPTLLPSWAPAVWGALAVVTDCGGALSHGAILAQERGIVAVLGTKLATRLVQTGQRLLVDGSRGLVVLSPSPSA